MNEIDVKRARWLVLRPAVREPLLVLREPLVFQYRPLLFLVSSIIVIIIAFGRRFSLDKVLRIYFIPELSLDTLAEKEPRCPLLPAHTNTRGVISG